MKRRAVSFLNLIGASALVILTTACWPVAPIGSTAPTPVPAVQAQQSSLYKAQPGRYTPLVVDDFTLQDSRRGREIPLKIYYPDGNGPFPVIVFSHGGGGSKDAFSELSLFWASHGYVTIHPTHIDRELKKASGTTDRRALTERAQTDDSLWQSRTDDVSFIISSLGDLERNLPQLRGKFDRNRIGVSGHSAGAFTSLLIAGTQVDTKSAENVSYKDDRAKAFLAISPQGTGQRGLDERAWAYVTAPVLSVTGTMEKETRQETFRYMPSGDKYQMVIEGASHSSYNDAKEGKSGKRGKRKRGPDAETVNYIHRYLESTSIAFWDAYLLGDNSAKQYLKSNAIAGLTEGRVAFSSK